MRKMKDSYVKHCVEDDLRIERVHYEVGRSPAWDLLVNGSVSLVLNLGGGGGVAGGGSFSPGDFFTVIIGIRQWLLESSGRRPEMLLSILQCSRHFPPPPPTKNSLAQNVNSTKTEKPCSILWFQTGLGIHSLNRSFSLLKLGEMLMLNQSNATMMLHFKFALK